MSGVRLLRRDVGGQRAVNGLPMQHPLFTLGVVGHASFRSLYPCLYSSSVISFRRSGGNSCSIGGGGGGGAKRDVHTVWSAAAHLEKNSRSHVRK